MADKFQLVTWAINTEDVMYGPTFTVATLPSVVAGGVIYVSDGAAGSPILAYSDGTDWLRSDTGAAVSAE
jgi:hypothetical protein